AGELIISQWASSFLEKGLGIHKTVGDIAGVCTFAAAMGIGRLIYGKCGEKINIKKMMTAGLFVLFCCYLLTALAPGSIVPLLAVFISGFGVSLIWPGTLSLAAETFPLAGSWIFALLAAGGDMGASFGPWLCGKLIDVSAKIPFIQNLAQTTNLSIEQTSLRIGMLSGAFFPLIGLFALLFLERRKTKK
ncbi:MAG: MFS transporter, partial [Clostridia bacterium]|nr:MFS transporter [Clostridia bacterium]